MTRATYIPKPGAVTAPVLRYEGGAFTRIGGTDEAPTLIAKAPSLKTDAPVMTTSFEAPVLRQTDWGAGFGGSTTSPKAALSGPSFRFEGWTWHPSAQTAVSSTYGRIVVTSPLFVQALAYLQRLTSTFTKADATQAAKYLDAAQADIPAPDAATWAFHAACKDWLGSKLEAAGKIGKQDAARKSGTDPAKWKDPSELGSNVGFLGALEEQIAPLASALGVTAGVALLGVALLLFLAVRK
jgi:hypothetical protein